MDKNSTQFRNLASRPIEYDAQNQFYRDAINYLERNGMSRYQAARAVEDHAMRGLPPMEVPEYEPKFVEYPARSVVGLNGTEVEAIPQRWKKIANINGRVR